MKQEYSLIIIVGLLVLAYVLDSIVNPLSIDLPSPYHFFTLETLFHYPFTSTSIVMKAVALIIAPVWFLSFLDFSKLTKGAILLALSGLMQLYTLQDVATGTRVIPLEWSLSLTLTGVVLLIPAVLYLLIGITKKATKAISEDPYDKYTKEDRQEDPFNF